MPDGIAVKAIDASHYEGDLQGLFDKIILHNSMFPETSYTVLGFGKDRGGTFRIIVKQTIIRGERPTIDEILKYSRLEPKALKEVADSMNITVTIPGVRTSL